MPERSLSPFQKDRAIKNFPSPLEYASYALFFPTLFYGPGFDYAQYRRFIDLSMFDQPRDQPELRQTKRESSSRQFPDGTRAAFQKAAAGLLWTFLFFKVSKLCPLDFVLSDQFRELSFARRLLVLHVFALVPRLNLYGIWALTEGACVLSGIGYNSLDPVTNEARWNRMQNVSPWGIELAQNPHEYLANWNLNTCSWLRNYVYLRILPQGQTSSFGASMATFLYSALWHGFHPGYYVTFVLVGLLQLVARG